MGLLTHAMGVVPLIKEVELKCRKFKWIDLITAQLDQYIGLFSYMGLFYPIQEEANVLVCPIACRMKLHTDLILHPSLNGQICEIKYQPISILNFGYFTSSLKDLLKAENQQNYNISTR